MTALQVTLMFGFSMIIAQKHCHVHLDPEVPTINTILLTLSRVSLPVPLFFIHATSSILGLSRDSVYQAKAFACLMLQPSVPLSLPKRHTRNSGFATTPASLPRPQTQPSNSSARPTCSHATISLGFEKEEQAFLRPSRLPILISHCGAVSSNVSNDCVVACHCVPWEL